MKALIILTIAIAALGCESPASPDGDPITRHMEFTDVDMDIINDGPAESVEIVDNVPTDVDPISADVVVAYIHDDDYLIVGYDYDGIRYIEAADCWYTPEDGSWLVPDGWSVYRCDRIEEVTE